MQIREQLRRFIVENFLFGQDTGFQDSDSFLEHGIIDSTGVLELVGFLEQRFGMSLQDGDLVPDNLDSIDRLAAFIRSRTRASAGASL